MSTTLSQWAYSAGGIGAQARYVLMMLVCQLAGGVEARNCTYEALVRELRMGREDICGALIVLEAEGLIAVQRPDPRSDALHIKFLKDPDHG